MGHEAGHPTIAVGERVDVEEAMVRRAGRQDRFKISKSREALFNFS